MNGYNGKAFWVDLSTEMIQIQDIPKTWYYDYLGGEGLGVRMFYEYIETYRDLLTPVAPVIFATGPFNATSAPEGGRLVLVFRSPAAGTLGLTNLGGHFAPTLKKAG